ncbi:hypothetical protein DFR24_3268 [Panacagrimonas perspica]|uniref:Meiotically Up-regulated Gene 113 (MUG113) protein n=1 Tax=Panacagrimonas perspica TaxID=381431 RepID=A0A4R7P5B4_9GAMM|nr:hypothetical protein [Panacagrimonas perspica]TDU28888.1 hypothetical protein DFR24_3268 [Panacagrimonas perspica]THD02285.1 hypothetical protein B1810_15265 [Panacagrimonas perspica]
MTQRPTAAIYLAKFVGRDPPEAFYKVGITAKVDDVRSRFVPGFVDSPVHNYEIDIELVQYWDTLMVYATAFEAKILDLLREYRRLPAHPFSGQYECFEYSPRVKDIVTAAFEDVWCSSTPPALAESQPEYSEQDFARVQGWGYFLDHGNDERGAQD